MARTGSNRKLSYNLNAAVHEWQTSISSFAHAMRCADINHIASYRGRIKTDVPLTINMAAAMERFIIACDRLKTIYAEKA